VASMKLQVDFPGFPRRPSIFLPPPELPPFRFVVCSKKHRPPRRPALLDGGMTSPYGDVIDRPALFFRQLDVRSFLRGRSVGHLIFFTPRRPFPFFRSESAGCARVRLDNVMPFPAVHIVFPGSSFEAGFFQKDDGVADLDRSMQKPLVHLNTRRRLTFMPDRRSHLEI